MKKLFTLSIVFLGLTFAAQAQDAATSTLSTASGAKSAETSTLKTQKASVSDAEMSTEEYEKMRAERKAKIQATKSESEKKKSTAAKATLKD